MAFLASYVAMGFITGLFAVALVAGVVFLLGRWTAVPRRLSPLQWVLVGIVASVGLTATISHNGPTYHLWILVGLGAWLGFVVAAFFAHVRGRP